MAVFGLAHRLSGDLWTMRIAIVSLLAFLAVGQGAIQTRERILIAVAVILTVVDLSVDPSAPATITGALAQASFLAAFMILIGVLKDAAVTSASVRDLGEYVTRQKPSRRYGAIATGAHTLTALTNVGALALLTPLIQAGVAAGRAAGDPPFISAIKERRQITAMQRGFAVVIIWAPTTVTQALLITMFPGAAATTILVAGLGLAILWMGVGWLEDLVRWRATLKTLTQTGGLPQRRPPLPAPRGAMADLVAVILALLVAVVVAAQAFDTEVVPALMMVAPLVTVGWIATQNAGLGARAAGVVRRRAVGLLTRTVPQSAPEAVTLAAAGYVGAMLAAVVPPEAVAWTLEFGPVGQFAVVAVLPIAIVALAQVAVTPIVFSVFIASAFADLGALPGPPALMILSIAAGWSLSLTCSPYTAGPLILRRLSGLDPFDLAWGWHWAYNAAAYLTLVAYLGVVAAFVW